MNPCATPLGTLLLCALGQASLWAQPLSVIEVERGARGQEIRALVVDPKGNVYIAGRDVAFVSKLIGDRIAYKTYLGAEANDSVESIAVDSAGLVYAAGATRGGGFIANVGPSGEQLWYRALPEPAVSVALHGSDLYYATAHALIKPDGRSLEAPGLLHAIAITATGVVYAAGDGFIAELDSQGNGWQTVYRWTDVTLRAITTDKDGSVFGAGVERNRSFAVRFAAGLSGYSEWTPLLMKERVTPEGIALGYDGQVWIAGAGEQSGFIATVTSGGELREIAASEGYIRAIAVDAAGHVILGGWKAGATREAWLVRTGDGGVVAAAGSSTAAGTPAQAAKPLAPRAGPPPAGLTLGTAAITIGSGAGANAVLLAAIPSSTAWISSTADSWLHLANGSTSGTGTAVIQFSFDANPLATARTGTISFNNGALLLHVYQAGTSYFAAYGPKVLVTSGVSAVTADPLGNVYFVTPTALMQLNPATQEVTTLVSSGFTLPERLTSDLSGKIYINDNGVIKRWDPGTQQLSTPNIPGLTLPLYLATDLAGNLYIGDIGSNSIIEWNPSTQQSSTLVTGITNLAGIAVDTAGNLYFARNGLVQK